MSGVLEITVKQDDDGQRLDRWLKKYVPHMPYVLAQKLARKGQIRVNGKRIKPDAKLSAGQMVRIPPIGGEPRWKDKRVSKEDEQFIRSLIIYEDDDIIAINKPSGLATQGGTKVKRSVDGLTEALKNDDGVKPRLVHRLDKDTSGVMLLARSSRVAKILGKSFQGRNVRKIYWALTTPGPEINQGTIKAPVMKAGGLNREKMIVDDEGQHAVSEYTTIDSALGKVAFVAFWPRTGRTHQIRVHAHYMGCPILGDGKYGGADAFIDVEGMQPADRLHLHAHRLILPHPSKKGLLDVSAPLPPDLKKSWKEFGFDTKMKYDPFEDLED